MNCIKTKRKEEQTKALKPPLKWAGGKRWLTSYLLPIWEEYKKCRLIEPFCGGLAITLALMPKRALLNDINPHLINFYNWLQKGLISLLLTKNNEQTFYSHRYTFNNLIKTNKANTKEAASLFYYLNRTGYNGLCRFNNSGEFNVPFGKYKTINYKQEFIEYKEKFKSWIFRYGDFENIVIKKGDFIYADPPYDVEFTKYSKENFRWNDQVRLVKWLSKQKCPIVISNQATPRIVNLYKDYGFKLRYIKAPRMISCTGSRIPVREVLAIKNIA